MYLGYLPPASTYVRPCTSGSALSSVDGHRLAVIPLATHAIRWLVQACAANLDGLVAQLLEGHLSN